MCQHPKNIKDIDTTISYEDYVGGFASWNKNTAMSPSGRTLPHYKIIITDESLCSFLVKMINLPIKYGFALEHWRKSVMPHLEKEAGKPYLTRFRVIQFFEADYNFFLKVIYGRRLVRYAESRDALNDQQWGSRQQQTTRDALFLSRLSKDLASQLKQNSTSMDNDATGCYDRIIVSLGMIACRRLGMPANAIKTQTDALQFIKYVVKTVFGKF